MYSTENACSLRLLVSEENSVEAHHLSLLGELIEIRDNATRRPLYQLSRSLKTHSCLQAGRFLAGACHFENDLSGRRDASMLIITTAANAIELLSA